VWDSASNRYRSLLTGWYVSRARILELLERAINARERQILSGLTAYQDGLLLPSVFAARTSLLVKRQYLQNAALAAGGWDRLTFADYGRIGGILRGVYRRIAQLAIDIEHELVSEAQARNRIHMYMGNARSMFYSVERERLPVPEPGRMYIERRILDPMAVHCDDCVAYAGLGWQPEGVLPVPSQACACDGNCRCTLERKKIFVEDVEKEMGK